MTSCMCGIEKEAELTETGWNGGCQGLRGEGEGRCRTTGTDVPSRGDPSGDLTCNVVTTVHSAVLHT